MISQEQYENALDLIEKYKSQEQKNIIKTCCVCKTTEIISLSPVFDIKDSMWSGGIVETINAGYGSFHDMDSFIVAICDDCITNLVESKIVEKI